MPLKLAGAVAARKLPPEGVVTDATAGAVLSRAKLTALPVKALPSLSVAVACTVYVSSACAAQVGRAVLLVQVAVVLPVVAILLAARANAPVCQATPFQNLLSLLRSSVKVVLLAERPTPPVLSVTLPLKAAGTVAARKMLPSAGVVTEAVVGAVLSRVKLTALPLKVLPVL